MRPRAIRPRPTPLTDGLRVAALIFLAAGLLVLLLGRPFFALSFVAFLVGGSWFVELAVLAATWRWMLLYAPPGGRAGHVLTVVAALLAGSIAYTLVGAMVRAVAGENAGGWIGDTDWTSWRLWWPGYLWAELWCRILERPCGPA